MPAGSLGGVEPPSQRQIKRRAASSLGRPRPASASLGQPRLASARLFGPVGHTGLAFYLDTIPIPNPNPNPIGTSCCARDGTSRGYTPPWSVPPPRALTYAGE
eukprot:scaffold24697_cov41-Phaeocystis_antarctica.AAC.2